MSSCIYCTFLVFIQWARSHFHNSRPETGQWFLVCLFLFNKSTTIFHGPCCSSTVETTAICSKLKWSHEPQVGGFTAKFWTFCQSSPMIWKNELCKWANSIKVALSSGHWDLGIGHLGIRESHYNDFLEWPPSSSFAARICPMLKQPILNQVYITVWNTFNGPVSSLLWMCTKSCGRILKTGIYISLY